jgi:hypothetical protein
VNDSVFLKRLEGLVSTPLAEESARDAYRWVLAMLKEEAAQYYEVAFSEPPISDDRFRQLRDEHSRLMQDYTIVAARLGMLDGKPIPTARVTTLRRSTGVGGYGER